MRLIVPLQGVVQGRGGLLMGSLIPCTLFLLFQFYLKRHRIPDCPSNPPSSSTSYSSLVDLPRTSSRSNLLSRRWFGRVRVSSRASAIEKPDDSPYYMWLNKFREDRYHRTDNPDGVIHLRLCDNVLCLDLIEK